MWQLVLTVSLNLQSYALFPAMDGNPVFMRTTTFKVAVGQFSTKAACETYLNTSPAPYLDANGNFPFTITTSTGVTADFPLVPNIVGCEKL